MGLLIVFSCSECDHLVAPLSADHCRFANTEREAKNVFLTALLLCSFLVELNENVLFECLSIDRMFTCVNKFACCDENRIRIFIVHSFHNIFPINSLSHLSGLNH